MTAPVSKSASISVLVAPASGPVMVKPVAKPPALVTVTSIPEKASVNLVLLPEVDWVVAPRSACARMLSQAVE